MSDTEHQHPPDVIGERYSILMTPGKAGRRSGVFPPDAQCGGHALLARRHRTGLGRGDSRPRRLNQL